MEISLREWLIIGGIIVIALILFDGWRRIRANRNRLRIDIDKTLSEIGETSHHNPELPNGGARVRSFAEAPLAEPNGKHLRSKASFSAPLTPAKESGSDRLDISTAAPEVSESKEPRARTDALVEEPITVSEDTDIPMLSDINPAELQDGMIDDFDLPVEENTSEPTPTPTPPATSDSEHLEWDPELERQFDNFDESDSPTVAMSFVEPEPEPEPQARHKSAPELLTPEDKPRASDAPLLETEDTKADYSGLDPLFDDIPSDPFNSDALDQETTQPNLYLDLDLEQPIHQIMANKAAAKDSGKHDSKDVSRRVAEKPRRRQVENPSFTLPLDEPEDDLLSDIGLSALESEFETRLEAEPPSKPTAPASSSPTPKASERPDNRAVETQAASSAASKSAAAAARKALTDMPDPEEVLVITVVGRNRQKLPGVPLKQVVEACGMEFGDMSIYHRFEGDAAASSLQFSMANAVNPGTFDPDAMDELETPAVSFFMSMREPNDPMTAYECMLATAETLAKHLDGDLLDEDRSVMREQTKEHYRQRIRDFEMQSRRRKLGR